MVRTAKVAEQIATDGQELPLQYVIDVMRNPKASQARRDKMAIAALPFCHARLQSIEGNPDKPIVHEHRIGTLDAARRIAFVLFTASNPELGRTLEHEPEKKIPA